MPETPTSDPELRDLLRDWQVDATVDPALARGVWARLEREKPHRLRAWLESVSVFLTRPVATIAAVVLFAVLGAVAAEVNSVQQHEARVSELAATYAQSIDPILMTHPEHAPASRP